MSEPTVSISLTVKDGDQALSYYKQALGAEELYRMNDPQGGVAHAEFMVGNAKIYLSEESKEWHAFAMPDGAKASCLFNVGTDDCDDSFNRSCEAGAESLSEPEDKFWGGRCAIVKDPFGYRWSFTQMVEELTPEEMDRRAKEAMGAV